MKKKFTTKNKSIFDQKTKIKSLVSVLNSLVIVLLLFFIGKSNAQVTTNGGSGLASTYTSLNNAITALNAATISSPVVITLTGNEDAPVGGFVITATGSIANTIIVKGVNATVTANVALVVGSYNDAIFKLVGADCVTIQDFTMQENAANTFAVAASNNMTEWGVALLYATVTNGAQNNIIKNNTISLNRNYVNTFGVYSTSNHPNTNAVTTVATATSPAGSNSGLRVEGNTISNIMYGAVVVGAQAAPNFNDGLVITSNTITNYGTRTTTNSPTIVWASFEIIPTAVSIKNTKNFDISGNTFTSSNGGVAIGLLSGIRITPFTEYPLGTIVNTIIGNTISLTAGGTTNFMSGIDTQANSANTTTSLTINDNNFLNFNSLVAATANIQFINSSAEVSTLMIQNNTFSNINTNTSGSVSLINHDFTMAAAGTTTVNNNRIVGSFTKTLGGGFVRGLYAGSSSPSGSTCTLTNNNFSNINVVGATNIFGIENFDGNTNSPNLAITNNVFNNWSGGTGNCIGMNFGYVGATSNIGNNTISNFSTAGIVTGMTVNNFFAAGNPFNISSNIFSNLTSTGSTVVAISSVNASPIVNITNNTISGLSGAFLSSNGMSISAGTELNISKNKIGGISNSGASGVVNGLTISGGKTVTVSNNLIGDLLTPNASNAIDSVRGINITSTVATSTVNVFFNTVNIAGISSGTNFGSSAIFHAASSTSTTAALNLRNNILVNNAVANGTGKSVAFKRSAVELNNFDTSSNNNAFFAPIFYTDGTNSDATLAAYKARVSPAETNSITENPNFLNTGVSNPNFLHINASNPTLLESAGVNIVGITNDFDGNVRQGNPSYVGTGTNPDIGADEFELAVTSCSSAVGGTSTAVLNTVCANQAAVLSNNGASTSGTGLSYQWQVGTTVGGPYTNVVGGSGGTSFNYTTNPLAVGTYYYVLKTTCSLGPVSTLSNEVAVVSVALPIITASSTISSYCAPGNAAVTLTAAGGTTYSWSPSIGLSAITGASVTASPQVTTTYTVIGTAGNCFSTTSVTITVNNKPSILPITAVSSTVCVGGSTQLNVENAASSGILFSEVSLFNNGTGATSPYPAYFTNDLLPNGTDYVEISNFSANPIDISGYVLSDYASSTSTATHTLTFPPGTIIPATGVAVVHLGTGPTDVANRFFSTGGATTWSSAGRVGIILKNGTKFIDVVVLNGNPAGSFFFAAALGVPAAHWSGFAPQLSGFAGVIRTNPADTNQGADWISSSNTMLQTLGSFANNYTVNAVSYSWSPTTFLDNPLIANPTVNNIGANTTYTVTATTNGCSTTQFININVLQTAAPTATSPQSLAAEATLSNVTISGNSIKWYATPTSQTELSSSTIVVASTTYYATQTVNGCESASRTAVFVQINLSVNDNSFSSKLLVYPNPSNAIFNVEIDADAKIEIVDLIGKQIFIKSILSGNSQIDLSDFAQGIYLMKITNELGQQKTIKLVKK